MTRVTKSRAGQIKAKVFDTTAIAAGIAAATRKITRLPSVELAMAVASRYHTLLLTSPFLPLPHPSIQVVKDVDDDVTLTYL